MTSELVSSLVRQVQRNCDIADAQYAGEDTLCIYLLRLRDYYHWENGIEIGESVDRGSLGDWIVTRESRWDALEEERFASLQIAGEEFDPFDNAAINSVLNSAGLVYSGGLGRGFRPTFFIGELERQDTAGSQRILVTDRELARCVLAPPAMSREELIFIRRDAMRRYLASMFEEWSLHRKRDSMHRIVSHYGYEEDPSAALEAMVEHELENLILHEIGEQVAGELIGDHWHELLERIDSPLDEMRARAVRDNLADCSTSLPAFVTFGDRASLDFYCANMTPLRRELFPGFCDAWRDASSSGDLSQLAVVIRRARAHWLKVSRQLVDGSWARSGNRLDAWLAECAF